MKTKPIAQLSALATKASQGLETCSQCNSGACCQNHKTLIIHNQEFKDRKYLFHKYQTETKQAITQYNETGLFTCPFFNHTTKRCNEYDKRFYTCATFLSVSPSENCSTGLPRTIIGKDEIVALMTDKHLALKKELLKIQKTPKVNLIDKLKELHDN